MIDTAVMLLMVTDHSLGRRDSHNSLPVDVDVVDDDSCGSTTSVVRRVE